MLRISQKKRKIGYTYGSVSGRYPFRREKTIEYESQLEADLLAILEFNDSIVDVESQPFTIEEVDETGKTEKYTPDFLVYFKMNGIGMSYKSAEGIAVPDPKPLLIEVKPRRILKKEWNKLEKKFRMGIRFAHANDMVFKIYDETKIRGTYFDNVKKLARYRRYEYEEAEEARILGMVEALGHCPIKILLMSLYVTDEQKGLGLGQIFQMIGSKKLTCDMCAPIVGDTVVWKTAE